MVLRARAIRDAHFRPLEQATQGAALTARATSAFKDRSGGTRKSIQALPGPGLFSARVRARGAAVFLESGTGKYGIRGSAYPIQARGGGFLAFSSGGRTVFARRVMHPGIKPTHFLENAAEAERPKFIAACIAAIHDALTR